MDWVGAVGHACRSGLFGFLLDKLAVRLGTRAVEINFFVSLSDHELNVGEEKGGNVTVESTSVWKSGNVDFETAGLKVETEVVKNFWEWLPALIRVGDV